MIEPSETARRKALVLGATDWLADLPSLVAELEQDWSFMVGRTYSDASEAFVAEVTGHDGTPMVLKILIPRGADVTAHEITVLELAGGRGCVSLLRHDRSRNAMLLEKLGPSLAQLGLPVDRRHDILTAAAGRLWRPAPDCGLPTGADKGRWLAEFVVTTWEALDRPCSEQAVRHALACVETRIRAHDDERAVLVHGDVHQWNALRSGSGDGFTLVDPDGLLAEAEYDLGVIMREDPLELMAADPRDRAHRLAARTGLNATSIWEWGVVERVSTGLICTSIGLQPVGRQMLAAADVIATDHASFA